MESLTAHVKESLNIGDRKHWRWGIMGTGKISADFATCLKACPDAKIQFIGSRHRDTAIEFGNSFGLPPSQCFGSYEDLVAQKDIDCIYIGTPHPQHEENVLLCLNAGHNVLCEKPLAVNEAQARSMIELARAKKLLLIEGMWTRFQPTIAKVNEILAEGLIGPVHCVTADTSYDSTKNQDLFNRVHDPNLAGGALLDVGVYPLAMAQMIFKGPPSFVNAVASFSNAEICKGNLIDEYTSIALKYNSGQIANLTCSSVCKMHNTCIISGEQGCIVVDPEWHHSERVTLYIEGGRQKSFDFPKPKIKGEFQFSNGELMVHEINEVHRCLESNVIESNKMSHQESIQLAETTDVIRQQLKIKYPFEVERCLGKSQASQESKDVSEQKDNRSQDTKFKPEVRQETRQSVHPNY